MNKSLAAIPLFPERLCSVKATGKLLFFLVFLGLVACAPAQQSRTTTPATTASASPSPGVSLALPPPGLGEEVPLSAGISPAEDPTLQDPAPLGRAVPVPTQEEESLAHQRAIEECYTYARALVARSLKIDRDRSYSGVGTHSYTPGYGSRDFSERVRGFAAENEMNRIYRSCMQARGYAGG